MFLLDTNTISRWIKAPNAKLLGHFSRVPLSDLAVSPIVEAELRYGLAKKGIAKSKVGGLVDRFLSAFQILHGNRPPPSVSLNCRLMRKPEA